MGFRFYATVELKPGKPVPLVFPTQAARDAYVDRHPGTAYATPARMAPKRAVGNIRTADQMGASR